MIKDTIKNLTRQGFFCTAGLKNYKNKYGVLVKKMTLFTDKEENDPFPSSTWVRRNQVTVEMWEKIFETNRFNSVDKVGILGGQNGAVIFDFDIKAFDSTEVNDLREIWDVFVKFIREKTGGQFYREKSQSGGEHLIFLIEDSYSIISTNPNVAEYKSKNAPTPKKTDKIPFVEVIGFGRPDDGGCGICYIAPSAGYEKLEGQDLTSLKRVESSIYNCAVDFWKPFNDAKKIHRNYPKNVRDLYEKDDRIGEFNRKYRIEDILSRHGYLERGRERFLYPGSSSGIPGVIVKDGRFVYSNHSGDPLNNGMWNDSLEVVCILEHRDKAEVLRTEFGAQEKKWGQSLTPQDAVGDRKITRLIERVFVLDDGTKYFKFIKRKGHKIVHEDVIKGANRFNGFAAMNYPSTYSERGEFRKLKALIMSELDKLDDIPEGKASPCSIWIDGKFRHRSDDDCYIATEGVAINIKGTYKAWKENVLDLLGKSPGYILPIVAGFAGPFVGELHKTFGINLVGDSNIGKTFSMRIANSIYRDSSLDKWSSSYAQNIGRFHSLNNTCICVDEFRGILETTLKHLIDLCSGDQRKKCVFKDGEFTHMNDSPMLNVIFLTSSEKKLTETARSNKISLTKGFVNRFIDIEVSAEDFDLNRSLEIGEAISKNTGVALEYFLSLVNIQEMKVEFQEYKQDFKREKGLTNLTRTVEHFIFLGYIAKKLRDVGVVDCDAEEYIYKFMDHRYKNASFEEDENQGNELLESIVRMINSTEYCSPNKEMCKPGPKNCFFVFNEGYAHDAKYLLDSVKFSELMSDQLGARPRNIISMLKTLKVLEEKRVERKVEYSGIYKKFYVLNLNKVYLLLGMNEDSLVEKICD